MADRLLLLDAPSLYFRAFFGVPPLTAPDGTPTNAIKGFLEFVAYLVKSRRPTHIVACMDADWRPAWRVAAVPSYKTHRVATGDEEIVPDDLERQVPFICAALDALGIAWLGVPGYEADDVIASLAAHATTPVDVVTGDRDLFQVVSDEREVRVVYVAKGVSRAEIVDEAVIAAKYKIPGGAYAEFALLRGDPSDGLPGAFGIGEKTAAALITRYGTVAAALEACTDSASDLRGDVRRKLDAAREYLAAADAVVRVATNVQLPPLQTRLPVSPADPAALVELCDHLNLDATFNRVLGALAETAAVNAAG